MRGKAKIIIMAVFVFTVFCLLLIYGYSYYSTSLEQRYFHPLDVQLRSSGLVGHGLGIIGAFFIVTGVFSYMGRKRFKQFSRWGLLKNWLQFHIFLCSLGSVLILFHTTFKFGGLVAFGFWSLVLVVISGVIGRFIYLQIPRSIEGRELSLQELNQMQNSIEESLRSNYKLDNTLFQKVKLYSQKYEDNNIIHWFRHYFDDLKFIRNLKKDIRLQRLSKKENHLVNKLIRDEISLNHRIRRLSALQRLFRYWHVIHLPFALVMLVIMVIHIVVVVLFGFKWIF